MADETTELDNIVKKLPQDKTTEEIILLNANIRFLDLLINKAAKEAQEKEENYEKCSKERGENACSEELMDCMTRFYTAYFLSNQKTILLQQQQKLIKKLLKTN